MGRRSAGLLAAILLGVAAPAGPPARALGDPRPAPAPPRTPEFVAQVNRAVNDGLDWLSRGQAEDGSFSRAPSTYPFSPPNDLGLQALSVYTARACGLPADGEVARLGFKRLRQLYLGHKKAMLLQNYQVSLTLLAIEAYHSTDPGPDGDDRYGRPPSPKGRVPEADLAWAKELVAWLLAAQTSSGSFGYGRATTWEDHSNAQFSLLALKAARRMGIEVPKKVFLAALNHFLAAQETSGPDVPRRAAGDDGGGRGTPAAARSTVKDRARGWDYQCDRRRGGATGSMTTAGVSSLVICRGELLGTSGWDAGEDARVVQAIHDGLAWLGHHFTVKENPASRGGFGAFHYYYLYGLERAGVLSGVAWMGNHDWYGEGAAYLLDAQQESGGWSDAMQGMRVGPRGAPPPGVPTPGDLQDTCFALLFLKKATFRVKGAVATQDAEDALDLAGASELDEDTFRAVFDSVFARYARADLARRGVLVADFVRLGKRAVPHLILRLEDADAAVRGTAGQVLERTTGATHGFHAEDPVEARAAAVAAWETWWFARRGKLSPDVGAGRFRDGP